MPRLRPKASSGKYSGANVLVGVSGTGGGFERFCKNETDLSNASRPIRLSEAARCHEAGIGYIQFLVANDGISLVVNRQNTWANCLTADELKKVWDRGSKVNNWNQSSLVVPERTAEALRARDGLGDVRVLHREGQRPARQSRSDYSASENDNVLVRGVAGERGGMGYFGLSYYLANKSRLKVLQVNGGRVCDAERRQRPEPHVPATVARALRLREEEVVQARRRRRVHQAHDRQREGDLQDGDDRPADRGAAGKAQRQYNTAIKNRKNY